MAAPSLISMSLVELLTSEALKYTIAPLPNSCLSILHVQYHNKSFCGISSLSSLCLLKTQ